MSEPTNRKKGGERLAHKGEQPPQKKREKKPDTRTKQQKIRDRALVTVTVVAAVIVVVFVAAKLIFVKPEVNELPTAPKASGQPVEGMSPNPHEVSGRKKDFYTFLVVGRDTGGGGNTDTIMLVAYDVPNQKLSVMSIPRDTMVNIPYDIKRINAVYNYNGTGEKGIDGLYKEVSQLVGFRPDFEVVVEWEGFGKLVDAIGGVTFDVPINMNYDDPTQDLHIHIKKGVQLLDGEKAMQVIRYRHDNRRADGVLPGYPDGDIGRIATQQAFMKEVIGQCLKAENIIANVGKYAKIFLECVETDLTLNNLAWFGQQAVVGGLQMENVYFATMPGNYNTSAWSRIYQNYQSYVLPYGDELVALVNAHFNPYLEDVTVDDLDIMVINRDGSLSSSTGKVEDSTASKPVSRPSATPRPTPEATDALPSESPVISPEVSGDPISSPEVSSAPQPSSNTSKPTTSKPVETQPVESRPMDSQTPVVSQTPNIPAASQAPEPTPADTQAPIPEPTPADATSPIPEPTPNPAGPPEGIPIL